MLNEKTNIFRLLKASFLLVPNKKQIVLFQSIKDFGKILNY